MEQATHRCSRCQQRKPVAEFSPSVVARPNGGGYCRACSKKRYGASEKAARVLARAAARAEARSAGLLCSRCKERRPAVAFLPSVAAKEGRQSGGYCRECRRATRDLKREYDRARWLNPAYPARQRDKWLRRLYGIDLAQYQALLARQGGRCACCGIDRDDGARGFSVDHDHVTGEIRGLLCVNCNVGIGALGDDATGVRRALVYLEKPQTAGVSAGWLF